MDRPFLRFNDYLGLSSIFQQESLENAEINQEPPTNIAMAHSNAWIDKRIEEILHQYSLKQAMQNSSHQGQQFMNNLAGNNYSNTWSSISSECLNNPNETVLQFGNVVSKPNMNRTSPPHASRMSSLTNSPLSPNLNFDSSPSTTSWLFSSASAPVSPFLSSASNKLLGNSSLNEPQARMTTSQQNFVNLPSSSQIDFLDVDRVQDKQVLTMQSLTAQRSQRRGSSGCSFCRNNKEVDDWVMSHQLKDSLNRVMCPILRSYVCPLCFASGDNAHTLGHCPLNPDKRNSSLPLAVRRRTNATGRVKL